MDLLLLFLLSSTITSIYVQGYEKNNDPNDEPFLPIYPVYPYSPKLIKRGIEKDTVTQPSPELYAPKVDAKDSYSVSFSANHPRDPYNSNYNPYTKIPSSSTYAYYGSVPYSYPTSPYNAYNSYSPLYTVPPSSYSTMPYSSAYPNYYYQSPYYYADYYNRPLFPPPPLPPPAIDYSGEKNSYMESNGSNKDKKLGGDNNYRSNDVQFVDGANYISAKSKDLDSQSSTQKTSSFQNQLEQTNSILIKNIPIPLPKTTYRVISVAGQPVGPDYPLPASYVNAQQTEELMNHRDLVKLLAQNLQQVPEYPARESTKNSVIIPYDDQNERSKNTRYVPLSNIIAKTGLTYVVNPTVHRKLNVEEATAQIAQTAKSQLKNIKYSSLAPDVYTGIEKPEEDRTESNEYEKYENYENSSSQDIQDDYASDKQQQSYDINPVQSYQNQNYVTRQTPRGYNYQYTSYNPSQTTSQRQPQQYQNNLDNGNFGVKTKKA
ncbi:uncharacterized protein LOC122570617 [Bombus pyrosoma]|uniref:uncharacterized protein LOC122570617 n=1 Tax=Bombus pyrosoma TaxID=396416 RepID=UPI001CB94248|nr:uncharacterized protein LOC122570617 [Bombus pyrosoma]